MNGMYNDVIFDTCNFEHIIQQHMLFNRFCSVWLSVWGVHGWLSIYFMIWIIWGYILRLLVTIFSMRYYTAWFFHGSQFPRQCTLFGAVVKAVWPGWLVTRNINSVVQYGRSSEYRAFRADWSNLTFCQRFDLVKQVIVQAVTVGSWKHQVLDDSIAVIHSCNMSNGFIHDSWLVYPMVWSSNYYYWDILWFWSLY